MNEKKPSERYPSPIGPFVDRSALLKMGYRDASSCLVMTPIALSELWKREKENLRHGFRGRQKDLDPYFVVDEVEEATRRFTKRLQALARAEKRRQYEKTYGPRRAEIDADLAKRYKLLHLHGAGAAAQAFFKVRLPSDPRPLLGNVAERLKELDALVSAIETAQPELKRDEALKQIALDPSAPPEPRALVWSTYAYFGGRIEAPMQGKTRGRRFSNDISSAYPAQIAKLPSTAGGRWRQVFRPTTAFGCAMK